MKRGEGRRVEMKATNPQQKRHKTNRCTTPLHGSQAKRSPAIAPKLSQEAGRGGTHTLSTCLAEADYLASESRPLCDSSCATRCTSSSSISANKPAANASSCPQHILSEPQIL